MTPQELVDWWIKAMEEYNGGTSHYAHFEWGQSANNRKHSFSPFGLLCEAYMDLGGEIERKTEHRTYGTVHFYLDPAGESLASNCGDVDAPTCIFRALGNEMSIKLDRIRRIWETDLFNMKQMAKIVRMLCGK